MATKKDPKYVKLGHRLRARGRMIGDVAGGSRWKLSGYDVQPFPEKKLAQKFVRNALRRGLLEPATEEEFDIVQEARETNEKNVKFYRGELEDDEDKPRQTIQESNLRSAAASEHEKIRTKLDKDVKDDNEPENSEVDLDDFNAEEIAEGLENGTLDADEVREYEYERDKPRKTVLRALGEEDE